ncbi:hypothetical protein P154DRAFT_354213 [Amniculicola lignicola CBS 123094]|uniref:Uncharacterized protein n=1 Tax=Amniculicola lignicola CBS 123094 TaxID=1392246 RepID=A0A6A5X136_9PLEO|nr:hypothetical protein P154DRAFT_354213 [Amniculicola lignicola CBS 123094]
MARCMHRRALLHAESRDDIASPHTLESYERGWSYRRHVRFVGPKMANRSICWFSAASISCTINCVYTYHVQLFTVVIYAGPYRQP